MSEEKKMPEWFKARRLHCQGLKPSDYFLYKEIKNYLDLDMRELLVLSLRYIYSNAHDPIQRDKILYFAQIVHTEDLDRESDRPNYTIFSSLFH